MTNNEIKQLGFVVNKITGNYHLFIEGVGDFFLKYTDTWGICMSDGNTQEVFTLMDILRYVAQDSYKKGKERNQREVRNAIGL